MKKIFLFVACASLMVMGAQAQTAEELFKAGKAEFDKYDKLFAEYTLAHGQNPDAPDATVGERAASLMNGFDLLQKALPLDTIIEYNKDGSPKIDKKTGKPKFKTKYSKDIVALLSGHINDVLNVGNAGLMGSDFATSYKAFKFFSQLIGSPLTEGVQFEQATLADVAFYEGYSAYQLKDYNGAFNAFKNAISKGYTENQVVDFKNSCLANIIQGFCDTKDYDSANAYIDKAIADDPGSALLYDMKGFVVEQITGLAEALGVGQLVAHAQGGIRTLGDQQLALPEPAGVLGINGAVSCFALLQSAELRVPHMFRQHDMALILHKVDHSGIELCVHPTASDGTGKIDFLHSKFPLCLRLLYHAAGGLQGGDGKSEAVRLQGSSPVRHAAIFAGAEAHIGHGVMRFFVHYCCKQSIENEGRRVTGGLFV